ncbi:MAG: hypothetical protein GXO17_04935 [Thermodesulfobacteria bacterium]|nr:hypothetical protein [Thermodesulfobacteriota bacterium]
MVKKDLVNELWLKFPDFRKKDLELVVDLLFERMADVLREGKRIEIRGFGRFMVKEQKGRVFRNPKTAEVRELPPRKRIIFKPGKDLKERLNQEAWASLDLGTQTFRLLIAKPGKDGLRPILRRRENVRLGEGLAETGRITEQAFERGLKALESFRKDLERADVRRYLAAGTAVFRKASNAREFLEAAKGLGFDIRVLSPEEEATFTAQGVLYGMRVNPQKPTLIVDVGGGSTEFIFCRNGEVLAKESLELGAVTFTKAYLKHEIPKTFELTTLEEKVREALSSLNPPFDPEKLVATGGTASCMAALKFGLERYHPDLIHGRCLHEEDLENLFEKLRRMTLEERRALKGMEPGREDIILAGIKIYALVLERFSLRELCVSETGILEGLLLHLAQSVTNISASA